MAGTQFEYLRRLGQTYNVNILLRNTQTRSLWIGKISRSLHEKGVNFRDLNNRALLAGRLAKLVKLPLIQGRVISTKKVVGFNVSTIPDRIDNNVFITPVRGRPLPAFLERHSVFDLKNPEALLAEFAFNAWIGNHDRKDADYVVAKDRTINFIDYQLCGPGFVDQPRAAIGAYAETYSLEQVGDMGWCLGAPQLLTHVRENGYALSDFAPAIESIQTVSLRAIRLALRGLTFTDERGRRLAKSRMEYFLRQRQAALLRAVARWVTAEYPRSQRPIDPVHGDSLYPDANVK